jgi:hypothetical protein
VVRFTDTLTDKKPRATTKQYALTAQPTAATAARIAAILAGGGDATGSNATGGNARGSNTCLELVAAARTWCEADQTKVYCAGQRGGIAGGGSEACSGQFAPNEGTWALVSIAQTALLVLLSAQYY